MAGRVPLGGRRRPVSPSRLALEVGRVGCRRDGRNRGIPRGHSGEGGDRGTSSPPSIVFTCGGTGGHIYPAVAIADRIRGCDSAIAIDFVGSRDRLEWRLVPQSGYAIRSVPCAPIRRPAASVRNVGSALIQVLGLVKALWILLRRRPAAVVGTGGYVTVPLCCAAWLLRIPVFLHESNAFPGLATRFLANTLRCATKVFLGFAGARTYLADPGAAIVTGNPVREAIARCRGGGDQGRRSRDDLVRGIFGPRHGAPLGDDTTCLCFMGGSLGAGKINEVLPKAIETLFSQFPNLAIIWQTGERYHDRAVSAQASESEGGATIQSTYGDRLAIVPYLEDMESVYSLSDLIVCRSGAITCSELVASGTPSVLIPSPNVTDDHQRKNAAALAEKDMAWVLDEADLSSAALVHTISEILEGNGRVLRGMRVALEGAPENSACAQITESIIDYITKL